MVNSAHNVQGTPSLSMPANWKNQQLLRCLPGHSKEVLLIHTQGKRKCPPQHVQAGTSKSSTSTNRATGPTLLKVSMSHMYAHCPPTCKTTTQERAAHQLHANGRCSDALGHSLLLESVAWTCSVQHEFPKVREMGGRCKDQNHYQNACSLHDCNQPDHNQHAETTLQVIMYMAPPRSATYIVRSNKATERKTCLGLQAGNQHKTYF